MIEFIDNIVSFFNYKDRVKYFIEKNSSMGFYYALNGYIGDVYGPMGSGRYKTIKNFYKYWKNSIDNEWRLRTKSRINGLEKR